MRNKATEQADTSARPFRELFPLPADATEDEIRAAIDHHVRNHPFSPLHIVDEGPVKKSDIRITWCAELGIPFWKDFPLDGMCAPEKFGEAIRSLLKERGGTLSDVARLMHVSPSTVSRWVKNPERLRAHTLGNLLVTVANVTWSEYEPLEDAFIRVGNAIRPLVPKAPYANEDALRYELETLAVLLDEEALEILVHTAKAFMGGHVLAGISEDTVIQAERDIDNMRPFFGT